MNVGTKASELFGRALRVVHAGDDKLATRRLARYMRPTLEVRSPEFASGGELPVSATMDGEGTAPSIAWSNVPDRARSFVVVCEDPDAPFLHPFVHWIVYGIPGEVTSIGPTIEAPAREGKNSTLKIGFTPATPPPGNGLHHYHFQVFAIDRPLDLEAGMGRAKLLDAMRGYIVAWGETIGTYARQPRH